MRTRIRLSNDDERASEAMFSNLKINDNRVKWKRCRNIICVITSLRLFNQRLWIGFGMMFLTLIIFIIGINEYIYQMGKYHKIDIDLQWKRFGRPLLPSFDSHFDRTLLKRKLDESLLRMRMMNVSTMNVTQEWMKPIQQPCEYAQWDPTDDYTRLSLGMKHILDQLGLPYFINDGARIGAQRYGSLKGCHSSMTHSDHHHHCYRVDDDLDFGIIVKPFILPEDRNDPSLSSITTFKDLERIYKRISNQVWNELETLMKHSDTWKDSWCRVESERTNNYEIDRKLKCRVPSKRLHEKWDGVDFFLLFLDPVKESYVYSIWGDSNYGSGPLKESGGSLPSHWIFPLKLAAFYGESIPVPNVNLATWMQHGRLSEFGPYCDEFLPAESFVKEVMELNQGWDLNQTRQNIRKELTQCALGLHRQGRASYFECLEYS